MTDTETETLLDSIDVTLPIPHRATGGQYELIGVAAEPQRPLPKPPFVCICGQRWPDDQVEAFLAHRHPGQRPTPTTLPTNLNNALQAAGFAITDHDGGYFVLDIVSGETLGGPYDTQTDACKRIGDIRRSRRIEREDLEPLGLGPEGS